ncbi:hypothetical protein [Pseudoalteromonas sp. BDTF-M6]|uniref:hypothetical protein n=1 Tax=Pseudoalteromonas sp. BDTF-M6 TaxID=2796132 RepID=UPI001BAEED91|nr:hypothetical protein [Pseudoalteromonas sp. BDTF-M6]MBS3798010.1 hypothetical protein [Pseudoalteromonas sp. BDTF-M6]
MKSLVVVSAKWIKKLLIYFMLMALAYFFIKTFKYMEVVSCDYFPSQCYFFEKISFVLLGVCLVVFVLIPTGRLFGSERERNDKQENGK